MFDDRQSPKAEVSPRARLPEIQLENNLLEGNPASPLDFLERGLPQLTKIFGGIAVPSAKQIISLPAEQSREILSQAFDGLVELVSANRTQIPPLLFHGANLEHIQGLNQDQCAHSGKLWFGEAAWQAPDPRLFTHDLVNAASKAIGYGIESLENGGRTAGGLLIFADPSLYEADRKFRYRAVLDESDQSLRQKYGTGLFAQRVSLEAGKDFFQRAQAGTVVWPATPIAEPPVTAAGQDLTEKQELIDRARAIYAVARALEFLDMESGAEGPYRPVCMREEMDPEYFKATPTTNGISYTWPDGYQFEVTPDRIGPMLGASR